MTDPVRQAARARAARLELARRQARTQRLATGPAQYLRDPVGFLRRYLPAFTATPYQAEILDAVGPGGKVTARGPRGLGKTALSAVFVVFFAVTREAAGLDWKIVVTSGSWFQLRAYFWPEVHRWARLLDWDALGLEPWRPERELQRTGINLTHGMASSASPDRAELIEGAHAREVLVVFDESKAIPRSTFDAIEGVFSGVGPDSPDRGYALAVSTPGAPAGAFYDLHRRRPGTEDWTVRHVTLAEAVAAGRVTDEWATRLGRLWGESSPLYLQHVRGEFAADDEDALIPIAWVEQAVERWRERQESGWQIGPCTGLGVDVARHGRDQTMVAVGHGRDHVAELRTLPRQDTAATAGDVARMLAESPLAEAVIDADGMGVGVVDQLAQAGANVTPFFGGQAVPEWRDRSGLLQAFNRRAAAWWHLREMLDPRLSPTLALPPDDELLGDLTGPRQQPHPRGLIKLEPKDQTKARLGRSPDRGDSVAYLCSRSMRADAPLPTEWVPSDAWAGREGGLTGVDGLDWSVRPGGV